MATITSLYRAIRHEVGMHTRALGRTDLHLTIIGLGTWAIGGPWDYGWGPQSDADSIATIQRALDLGINWIDTAPAYGLGHGEEVVGRAIRGRRNQVILATNWGLVWQGESQSVFGRLTAASIQKEAEDSLRRLGTNVIDLYQIHWPNPAEEIEEAWEAIHRLIQQGKVRYGGISNFSVEQMSVFTRSIRSPRCSLPSACSIARWNRRFSRSASSTGSVSSPTVPWLMAF